MSLTSHSWSALIGLETSGWRLESATCPASDKRVCEHNYVLAMPALQLDPGSSFFLFLAQSPHWALVSSPFKCRARWGSTLPMCKPASYEKAKGHEGWQHRQQMLGDLLEGHARVQKNHIDKHFNKTQFRVTGLPCLVSAKGVFISSVKLSNQQPFCTSESVWLTGSGRFCRIDYLVIDVSTFLLHNTS